MNAPSSSSSQGASQRLAQALQSCQAASRTALIPYIMAGDPGPDATVAIMHALVRAGANVIELGVPFSDPMADGPVIQLAAERALAHRVGLRQVLQMVAEFRQTDATTPVVLMGYANPIERMGIDTFAQAAQAAGVDGVLIVDYPPEAATAFSQALAAHGMDPIFLLAPTTTSARIRAVGQLARGYVYYVSLKGVTGAGHLDTAEVASKVAEIRQHVQVPVGVGFGIRDAASACAVADVADAVVIGSRLVQEITHAAQAAPTPAAVPACAAQAAGAWLASIRQALDRVTS